MTRWHKADALHSINLWHERANDWLASIRGMHEGVSLSLRLLASS